MKEDYKEVCNKAWSWYWAHERVSQQLKELNEAHLESEQ